MSLTVLTGCASGSSDGNAAVTVNGESGWRGTAIRAAYPLPDQQFTDTSGSPVVPSDDAGQGVTLVFFGYTHCPDICNVVLANIAAALRGSDKDVRDGTRMIFVSTDPVRDEPGVVREYLDRFDPRFEGLVAPVGTVARAAEGLHISYERPDGSTGGHAASAGVNKVPAQRSPWLRKDDSMLFMRVSRQAIAGLRSARCSLVPRNSSVASATGSFNYIVRSCWTS